MYFCSLLEQKCYFVSKRSIPLDNFSPNGSCRPRRDSFNGIVHDEDRIRDRRGQRYIGTNWNFG